ncbi:MAG TPA: bis(5'-nucleosyl)-tetraphosphatase (symmetrical) YqeK [Clostridia bacterium]|nr:bis(5'-nucleosyl)-tetraphosphatase (symmetrical) YqeK [Clostridia bacterium]
MTIEEIKTILNKSLKAKRFEHSVNVMNESVRLAALYGENEERAAFAGLLHDCAREIKGIEAIELCRKFGIDIDEVSYRQPELLHGALGSILAKKDFGVDDEAVLKAIRYHTTGHPGMTLIEKIVFLADYTEPARDFPGVQEIRHKADKNIDDAILTAMNSTINFVLKKNTLLHMETINARNHLLNQRKICISPGE